MSIFTVWEWWKGSKGKYADNFVEVEISGSDLTQVCVALGQNEDECIGIVNLPPDLAEEFARALLEAAAQVRAMGDMPTP